MKVYLASVPYIPGFASRDARWQDASRAGTVYYPIWLAYATGILERSHQARLVDAGVWKWSREKLIADIKSYAPDLIVINTSFPSLKNDVDTAEAIKRAYPTTRIVMVGPPTSLLTESILASPAVDFVARREYDLTLEDLAGALSGGGSLQKVRGISYRDDGAIRHNPDREYSTSADLDSMPFVSQVYQRHLRIKDYFLNYAFHPMVQIFGGRGCPFQCTFCCWPQTFMGRQHRMRSPANVVNEMVWVSQNLPEVKSVFLEDDTFTVNRQWIAAFAAEYRQRHLRLPWSCQARADVDYETMKTMREANCFTLVVGYESGSDELLQNIKKGTSVAQIRRFIKDADKAGMPIHGNFMVGLPGETKETIQMTRQLALESKSVAVTVEGATPFPGTVFYEWAKSQGYLLVEDPRDYLDEKGRQKIIISYPQLSSADIKNGVDSLLKGYFLSPRYLPIALKRLFHRYGWQESKVIWHSARMFLGYYFKKG